MPKSTSFQDGKRADWLMLCQWASNGLICLKYLDESGFERTSSLNYSYSKRGEQKSINQPRRRGRIISVLGFWEPQHSFEYGAVVGGFNSERYLQLLEWQAHLAQQRLQQTGQITVIIQDGASFHRSKKVQQRWQRWQQQGLYIFFLPPYSPQMNRIEDEWLHLKRDELSSQIFDDEYELALALIHAIENRANKANYSVKRFIFNHV